MLIYIITLIAFSFSLFANIPPQTNDKLGRLTDESITDSKNGDYTASYTYDAVSNRVQSVIDGVTTQYSYDDNDQLIQQGGTTYTYNANGNTLSETLDQATTTYTYNSKNQLIERSNPTQTVTYTYDKNNIRTSKTIDTNTIEYLVDSNRGYAQVLEEYFNSKLHLWKRPYKPKQKQQNYQLSL